MKAHNWTVFSLMYVPFICKVVKYGSEVNIIGPKKFLYATSYPLENVHKVCTILGYSYYIPALPLPGFLNLTLTPSN